MVRRVSQDVRFSLLDLSSKRTYSSCLSMPTLRHLKWQQLDLRELSLGGKALCPKLHRGTS